MEGCHTCGTASMTQSILNDYTKCHPGCTEGCAKDITELIVGIVALYPCLLQLVEGPSFLELMVFLEPGYMPPCAADIDACAMQAPSWTSTAPEYTFGQGLTVAVNIEIWYSILKKLTLGVLPLRFT